MVKSTETLRERAVRLAERCESHVLAYDKYHPDCDEFANEFREIAGVIRELIVDIDRRNTGSILDVCQHGVMKPLFCTLCHKEIEFHVR